MESLVRGITYKLKPFQKESSEITKILNMFGERGKYCSCSLRVYNKEDIWSLCSNNIQKSSLLAYCFKDFFEIIYKSYEDEHIEEVVLNVRKIWQRINSFVFEDKFSHRNQVMQQAKNLLHEFKEVQVIRDVKKKLKNWLNRTKLNDSV